MGMRTLYPVWVDACIGGRKAGIEKRQGRLVLLKEEKTWKQCPLERMQCRAPSAPHSRGWGGGQDNAYLLPGFSGSPTCCTQMGEAPMQQRLKKIRRNVHGSKTRAVIGMTRDNLP